MLLPPASSNQSTAVIAQPGDPVSAGEAVKPAAPAPVPDLEAVCSPQEPVKQEPGTVFKPQWVQVGTVAAPTSATAGPLVTTSPRQCFERSPEGALYSAANLTAEQIASTSGIERGRLLEARLAHQGNYDLQHQRAIEAPSNPAPEVAYQFAGYRLIDYSSKQVELEVVVRTLNSTGTGALIALNYVMVWDRNDWLMVPPGEAGQLRQQIDSFENYVPWGSAG